MISFSSSRGRDIHDAAIFRRVTIRAARPHIISQYRIICNRVICVMLCHILIRTPSITTVFLLLVSYCFFLFPIAVLLDNSCIAFRRLFVDGHAPLAVPSVRRLTSAETLPAMQMLGSVTVTVGDATCVVAVCALVHTMALRAMAMISPTHRPKVRTNAQCNAHLTLQIHDFFVGTLRGRESEQHVCEVPDDTSSTCFSSGSRRWWTSRKDHFWDPWSGQDMLIMPIYAVQYLGGTSLIAQSWVERVPWMGWFGSRIWWSF